MKLEGVKEALDSDEIPIKGTIKMVDATNEALNVVKRANDSVGTNPKVSLGNSSYSTPPFILN